MSSANTELRWPKLVLFDVGGVLVSLHSINEAFPVEEVLRGGSMGTNRLEEELAAFMQSEIFLRFETGLAGKQEFFGALQERFSWPRSLAALEECYGNLLGPEVEGMNELVQDLKRTGVRVAGLTDTSVVHVERLKRYPAVTALEAVVASCETGRRKPEPETYLDALRRLQVQPGDVLYTDDRQVNVDGARAAGIRAEVFRGERPLRTLLGLD